MSRIVVCSLLAMSLVPGQELRLDAMPIHKAERESASPLYARGVFRQNAGSTVPPAVVKEKKKSRKGLWIGLAVAGAATVAVLVVVDKRLGNEGRGIFR